MCVCVCVCVCVCARAHMRGNICRYVHVHTVYRCEYLCVLLRLYVNDHKESGQRTGRVGLAGTTSIHVYMCIASDIMCM